MNALLRPIVNGPSAASAGPSSLGASPPLPENAASTSAAASDVATPANSLFCIWFLLELTRVTLRQRETFLTIALSVCCPSRPATAAPRPCCRSHQRQPPPLQRSAHRVRMLWRRVQEHAEYDRSGGPGAEESGGQPSQPPRRRGSPFRG